MSNTQIDEQMDEKMDEKSFSMLLETIPQAAPQAESSSDTSQKYGVLKSYFYTPKRGDIWGAFSLLFDGVSGAVIDNVFWVTRALDSAPIDLSMGWQELNKLIPKMGVYEKNMGEKMAVSLMEVFSPSVRVKLCQSGGEDEQMEAITLELRDAFERTTHYFLDMKLMFEPLTPEDLTKAGVPFASGGTDALKKGSSDTDDEEKSFAGTLITCLPVIDPVYGKPVSELAPGDLLEVKLQGGIGASDLIQKFLNTTRQEAVFPVHSIEKKDDEKTYVLLEVNEEVKGLITVTKDLRLRVLNMPSKKPTVSINLDNLVLFGTFVLAFIIIALVVNYLLFP